MPTKHTFSARITRVEPEMAGQRDQTDPWVREVVAVIDGQWAESHGHPTPDAAEKWALDLLQRAGTSGPAALMRWVVTADGEAPAGPCPGEPHLSPPADARPTGRIARPGDDHTQRT